MIHLNEELQHALDAKPGQPVPVMDARTGNTYVLIPSDVYQNMKSALECALDVRGGYALMDEVARKEGWDDPEMDSYNVYARQPQP